MLIEADHALDTLSICPKRDVKRGYEEYDSTAILNSTELYRFIMLYRNPQIHLVLSVLEKKHFLQPN